LIKNDKAKGGGADQQLAKHCIQN